MRKMILASHGDFSKGLCNSIEMIVGDLAKEITAYSLYPGENAEKFAQELCVQIQENKTDEYVILSDLYGASVCSALSALTEFENVVLFSGMNINIVLEALLSYPDKLSSSDIEELIEKARMGIQLVQVKPLEDVDKGEF